MLKHFRFVHLFHKKQTLIHIGFNKIEQLPAFIKPTSLPRSFGGAQCAIITVILGQITPCARPTTNRNVQSTP